VQEMDYKAVIEEQIRELQKVQDKEVSQERKINLATVICNLCDSARSYSEK
jgi:hypothetical protein